MDIKSIVVTDAGFDVTLSDDTVKSYVDAATVAVATVNPEDKEIDVLHTDGSTAKFVRASE